MFRLSLFLPWLAIASDRIASTATTSATTSATNSPRDIELCTTEKYINGIKQCTSLNSVVVNSDIPSNNSDHEFTVTPETIQTGIQHMHNALIYQGSSTPIEQRDSLKLRGLIPSGYIPFPLQIQRCMQQFRNKSSSLEKYTYLQSIQDVDERLYYALLVTYTTEIMPIVYTPTVGEACIHFSSIYRGTPRGLYLSLLDRGSIHSILFNHFHSNDKNNITTIVVTDGERILGLGDQGVNGMPIPIGKLALYTACAGIYPSNVLPVQIDVGTNNDNLLQDPYYLGLRQHRQRGPVYDELISEFFQAAQDVFGRTVLIQFEDFGNINAFRLLHEFQNKATTFNDDIQGTAAVALGGIFVSTRITKTTISEYTYLFAGAGEAGCGIAELIAYAISKESSIPIHEARKRIYLTDSLGLVTKYRPDTLQHHKLPFAHDVKLEASDLLSAIQQIKPSVLIGVSAIPNIFNQTICKAMAHLNERPVIFALSNPTSKAECTASEAYQWTEGKCVFASGSPFDPVTLPDGRQFIPGQGNNAYVFPGIGLGALAAGSTKIDDDDMLIAAETLASLVTQIDLDAGSIYPPLSTLRDVSAHIAAAIVKSAHKKGVATKPKPDDILSYVKSIMYNPLA